MICGWLSLLLWAAPRNSNICNGNLAEHSICIQARDTWLPVIELVDWQAAVLSVKCLLAWSLVLCVLSVREAALLRLEGLYCIYSSVVLSRFFFLTGQVKIQNEMPLKMFLVWFNIEGAPTTRAKERRRKKMSAGQKLPRAHKRPLDKICIITNPEKCWK